MTLKLLVDSADFWAHLQQDFGAAQQHVWVQSFSLEGDRVGKNLYTALAALEAVSIKIVVDSFGKWAINDKYVFLPHNFFNAELRREFHATTELINRFKRLGEVKYTNPVGWGFVKFAKRDHKKLIVIDNKVAYIGGINFSEHNFAWHDLMLRIEEPALVQALAQDFLATWGNQSASRTEIFPHGELYILDGQSNHQAFARIFDLIEQAQEEIFVESPYLSFPLCDKLGLARARGLTVNVVAPGTNNWPIIKEYITQEAANADFNLHFYSAGMTHLKAICIDRKYLVLGSSNYDYLSYRLHKEILFVITDPTLIADFQRRVVAHDLTQTELFATKISFFRRRWVNLTLRAVTRLVVFFTHLFQR